MTEKSKRREALSELMADAKSLVDRLPGDTKVSSVEIAIRGENLNIRIEKTVKEDSKSIGFNVSKD